MGMPRGFSRSGAARGVTQEGVGLSIPAGQDAVDPIVCQAGRIGIVVPVMQEPMSVENVHPPQIIAYP